MDKCCNNCKWFNYGCDGFTNMDSWDTSKDFCSKWEEKEEIIAITINKMIHNACEGCQHDIGFKVTNYFKQRIEDSLGKIYYFSNFQELSGQISSTKDEVYKTFDWILK